MHISLETELRVWKLSSDHQPCRTNRHWAQGFSKDRMKDMIPVLVGCVLVFVNSATPIAKHHGYLAPKGLPKTAIISRHDCSSDRIPVLICL